MRHLLQLGFAALAAPEIRQGVRVPPEVVGGEVASGDR